MQSDQDFIMELRDYLQANPQATMIDIKMKFMDIPTEKILYTINEMLISP